MAREPRTSACPPPCGRILDLHSELGNHEGWGLKHPAGRTLWAAVTVAPVPDSRNELGARWVACVLPELQHCVLLLERSAGRRPRR
jgi:hypothetical protein